MIRPAASPGAGSERARRAVTDLLASDRGVVKICGLREPEQARVAVEAGADLLGFILAPARRRVTQAMARDCARAAREAAAGRTVLTVGVFVDASAEEMNEAVATIGLDLLQLHGTEPPGLLARLDRPVIKALRPRPGADVGWVAIAAAAYAEVPNGPVALLLDGFSATAAGGEGVGTDWGLVGGLAAASGRPVLLAGGLDAGNVAAAIAASGASGVDVSSGVETDGVKDAEKIWAFEAAARSAFAARPATSGAPGRTA